MEFDSTFWVAISFVIFFGGLIYLKVPHKINEILNKLKSNQSNYPHVLVLDEDFSDSKMNSLLSSIIISYGFIFNLFIKVNFSLSSVWSNEKSSKSLRPTFLGTLFLY